MKTVADLRSFLRTRLGNLLGAGRGGGGRSILPNTPDFKRHPMQQQRESFDHLETGTILKETSSPNRINKIRQLAS